MTHSYQRVLSEFTTPLSAGRCSLSVVLRASKQTFSEEVTRC